MPTLKLTNDQVVNLVKQLPPDQQEAVFAYLLTQHWNGWMDIAHEGTATARTVAERHGLKSDEMSEDDRERFIDDLVHRVSLSLVLPISSDSLQHPLKSRRGIHKAVHLGQDLIVA